MGAKREPSQEYLKANLDYDSLTGIAKWKEPRSPRSHRAGGIAGYLNRGYRIIKIDGEKYQMSRVAWIWMNGPIPEAMEIDHVNGRPEDNRIDNLRLVTHQQQMLNRRKPRTNKSGRTGVVWRKRNKAWQARINIEGHSINLGLHRDYQIACEVRDAAEEIYFGEFKRKDKAA